MRTASGATGDDAHVLHDPARAVIMVAGAIVCHQGVDRHRLLDVLWDLSVWASFFGDPSARVAYYGELAADPFAPIQQPVTMEGVVNFAIAAGAAVWSFHRHTTEVDISRL